MDPMQSFMNGVSWVGTHPEASLMAVGIVLAIGSAAAKFTKGKEDDNVFSFLTRIFSLVNHRGVPGFKLPGQRAKRTRE